MKLKPIKFPRKIKFTEVKRYGKFITDKKCFLLIRPKNKKIEIGICNYQYKLVKAYRGSDVKSLYKKIIDDGWITEMKHAAYLGMELEKAKNSLKNKTHYIQDSA